MSKGEISLYVDLLLAEAIFAEPSLYKKAGFGSDLFSKMKDYFGSRIDKNNPEASVLNELAPGVLWVAFQAMGLGKWGLLGGLLMSVFHVNVYSILTSLYEKGKGRLARGKKIFSRDEEPQLK